MKTSNSLAIHRASNGKEFTLLALATAVVLLATSCATQPKQRDLAQETQLGPDNQAATGAPIAVAPFDLAMEKFGAKTFYGNFHGHHYMPTALGDQASEQAHEQTHVDEHPQYWAENQNEGLLPQGKRSLAAKNQANSQSSPQEDAQTDAPKGAKGFQDDGVNVRMGRGYDREQLVVLNLKSVGINPMAGDGTPIEEMDAQRALGDKIYFEHVCRYAHDEGGLDVMYLTPHTKLNDPGTGSKMQDTRSTELEARRQMLGPINDSYGGSFLCGLGQEASSISAGNHLGIFGTMSSLDANSGPVYFPPGDFKTAYEQIGGRVQSNSERVFLQFNHPDVRRDLGIGVDFNKESKNSANDYGLDDFAPAGCYSTKLQIKRIEAIKSQTKDHVVQLEKFKSFFDHQCVGKELNGVKLDEITVLTEDILRATFENMKKTSGDRFRMMEIFSPHTADGGATTNDKTAFARAHERTEAKLKWGLKKVQFKTKDGKEKSFSEPIDYFRLNEGPGPAAYFTKKNGHTAKMGTMLAGTYDYIFYLNMGLKIAPTANQDNHLMNWGSATANRTGIIAQNLREGSVLDALDERHLFATEDRDAKVLLYVDSAQSGENLASPKMMGDEFETSDSVLSLKLAYSDATPADSVAGVRLYRYKKDEALSFMLYQGPLAKTNKNGYKSTVPLVSSEPRAVARYVSFEKKGPENNILNGTYKGTNPSGPPALTSPFNTHWTSDTDPSIVSDQEIVMNIDLEEGGQYVFAEITQKNDLDRIYTAPIWVTKKIKNQN